MGEIKLTDVIAPAFYGVHWDIIDGKHTYYDLSGGRGSTKSSFVGTEIPLGMMQDAVNGMKKQLRHEIIHAFLAESGLQANFEHYKQFGHEETIVDWFAIQFPKIMKTFEEIGAL